MTPTNIDDLIADLGRRPPRGAWPAPSAIVVGAVLLSLIVALALSTLWLKPRSDLAISLIIENHVFLLKLAFAVGVVVSALPIVRDLSIPGRRIRSGSVLAVIPFVVILVLAWHELGERHIGVQSLHDKHAMLECLWQIPTLAVPAFIILTIAVRRLGPTDLSRTGAYIGLLAGGIGTAGYALHCHSDSVAFVGIAYTLAIVETALFGALVGPRILRWR
jgi:hypothetical protein